MEFQEKHLLPMACQGCKEEDCYNCDTSGERWYLTEDDELHLCRKSLERSIDRLHQQIVEINNRNEINILSLEETDAQMTQQMWEQCLWACIIEGDVEQYNRIWNEHLDFADNMMLEFQETVEKNLPHLTKEEIQESFDRFKARMRDEFGEDFI